MKRALTLAIFLLIPHSALACACCADPGFRVTYTSEIGDWHQRQLDQIAFAPTANLYTDACGDDCIKGVTDPKPSYDIVVTRKDEEWQIKLDHNGRPEGALFFALPETYQHFSTDLTPAPETMMPAPYSEFRHRVQIKGTGSFETSTSVEGDLIFAGQSVGQCDALQASSHWFLDVRTEETRWRLFGDLAPGDP